MTEKALTFGGYTILALGPEGQSPRAEAVCICGAEDARTVVEGLPQDAALLAIGGVDWNRELSPWPAKRCFKGGEDFAGEAPLFLRSLLELLPKAETALNWRPARRVIAGYSLAGLFSLWAFCETDAFAAAVSASGSLWFDDFHDYLSSHLPQRPESAVYLSLGDAEEKTRNPRLAAVGERTRSAHALLLSRGLTAALEWNPGGHFQNPPARLRQGVRWALQHI